ncbi:MAG: glycosyltransferase family 39 protein [Candidatus Parvarchaeota archaeon]|nr:glycosyltransferase family 39 protein [Candidatus Jingweiarchaeum tengchongense]MCW1298418.1 glycosyltransferase family 39 protein [Candidatus Jingweiarchaeum tengchongense]MCW1310828.1 glycosyltransferase family 39 protein [Candidatus Jingweiarchaeum tengchongense]
MKKNLRYILCIALFLRIFVVFYSGGVTYSDEIYQSIEQAHQFIFNYSIGAFGATIRSIFYPLIIAFLFRLFSFLSYDNILISIKFFHSIISIFTVIGIYYLGKNIYNEKIAILASFLCSIWWEILFFSSRTLKDPFSVNFLLIGLALLTNSKKQLSTFLSGLLIALSFIISYTNFIFLIPIFVYIIYQKNPRKILIPFIFGFILICIFQGFLDLFMIGSFFSTPIQFFTYNILEGKSVQFGIEPFYYYFIEMLKNWGLFSPFFLVFLLLGILKKKKGFLIIDSALLFFILLSLVQHKEYRYIFPVLPFFLLIIADGIISFCNKLKKYSKHALFSLLILISINSFFISLNTNWSPRKEICDAMRYVGEQDDSTGVIIFETWSYTCGYTYLHKNIPILFFPAQGNKPKFEISSFNDLDHILTSNETMNYLIFTYEQSSFIQYFEEVNGINFTTSILNRINHLIEQNKFIELSIGFKNIRMFKRVD